MLLRPCLKEHRQRGIRFFYCHTRLQTGDHIQIMTSAVGQTLGRKSHGRQDIAVLGLEVKAGWKHADHRIFFVVQKDFASHQFAICREASRPQLMGDQRYMLRAWTVLIGRECAPKFRRYAENGEQIVRGLLAFQFLWLLAFPAKAVDLPGSCGDALKELGLVLPIRVIAGRRSVARESHMAVVFVDRNEAAGIAEGERAQQHGIHHAENGGRCADS